MKSDLFICTVEIASDADEVDAGTDITLDVRIEGPQDRLQGSWVSIRNHEDVEQLQVSLKPSDDEEDDAYVSDGIVVAAPRTVGEHVYRAVIVAPDKEGKLQELVSGEVRFAVRPHAAVLNVWDLPSAIVAGERFKFMVGVKCSAGCGLAGHGLRVLDREGVQVRAANLSQEVWPDTDALHYVEVEAEAPRSAGSHAWEIRTADWDCELPHAGGAAALMLKVVNPPDCEVTVEVRDREQQTPIAGAIVVMHPYRATTGENGVATLKVSKGTYDIMVSGPKCVSLSIAKAVTADTSIQIELDEDPPWEPPDEV